MGNDEVMTNQVQISLNGDLIGTTEDNIAVDSIEASCLETLPDRVQLDFYESYPGQAKRFYRGLIVLYIRLRMKRMVRRRLKRTGVAGQ